MLSSLQDLPELFTKNESIMYNIDVIRLKNDTNDCDGRGWYLICLFGTSLS